MSFSKPNVVPLMFFDAQPRLFVTKFFREEYSIILYFLASCITLAATATSFGGESILLQVAADDGLRLVRTLIEVDGTMRVNPDGKKVRQYPMTLVGKYESIQRSTSPERSIRYYRVAETEASANGNPAGSQLPEEKKLIVHDNSTSRPVLYSPSYTLSREELDLINIPGDPAILGKLLPSEPVEIGASWSPDNRVLADLLVIDAIQNHDVTVVLREIDAQGLAKLELQGEVSGSIGGVATEVTITARLNFDTSTKSITWFAASLQEDRSIGHATSGFKTNAVIRTQIAPTEMIPELADSKLASLNLEPDAGRQLLAFEGSRCGFRVLHDRDWFAMAETEKQTVFRRVENGELIAQVNVNRLTDLPAGEQVTLEGFEADVKKALGDRLGQVVDAAQGVNSQGLRELRVSAIGTANELPITWVYYLISNDQGRRYSVIFTYETKLAEQFAEGDRSFMSGFDLFEQPQPTIAANSEDDSEVESTTSAAVSQAKAEQETLQR